MSEVAKKRVWPYDCPQRPGIDFVKKWKLLNPASGCKCNRFSSFKPEHIDATWDWLLPSFLRHRAITEQSPVFYLNCHDYINVRMRTRKTSRDKRSMQLVSLSATTLSTGLQSLDRIRKNQALVPRLQTHWVAFSGTSGGIYIFSLLSRQTLIEWIFCWL